jgi:hypothetical protein
MRSAQELRERPALVGHRRPKGALVDMKSDASRTRCAQRLTEISAATNSQRRVIIDILDCIGVPSRLTRQTSALNKESQRGLDHPVAVLRVGFGARMCGQHYKYMVREMIDIREGARGNSNPRMVEVVKPLTTAELEAVGDYISRLPADKAR